MNPTTRVALLTLGALAITEIGFALFSGGLRARLRPYIRDLRFQKAVLLSASSIQYGLQWSFRLLRWALRLILLSVLLPIIGLHYPQTDGLARQVLAWLGERLWWVVVSCWNYLPNLLTILVTLALGRGALKLNSVFFGAAQRGEITLPGFDRRWAEPTRQIVFALTLLVVFSTVLPLLPGAASPVFRGASILVGVLLSLGSGPAVTNLVSGLSLTYSNAFQVGDVVLIGGYAGRVVERTLLITRLRTFKQEEVTIPNSTVMNGKIVNYSNTAREGRLLFYVGVTLGYDVSPEHVEKILLQAAAEPQGWCLQPAPFVLHTQLEGSWVGYELNVAVDRPENTLDIYSALRRRILESFHAAGIELMTPTIHALRDANFSTVPRDLKAPGQPEHSFQVRVIS